MLASNCVTILFSIFCCKLSLFEAIESISLMKTIDGAVRYALAKSSRIFSSDAPDTPETNSVADIG
ncbi:hypothetical protein AAHE18_13G225600 [Arachis hypogaea]